MLNKDIRYIFELIKLIPLYEVFFFKSFISTSEKLPPVKTSFNSLGENILRIGKGMTYDLKIENFNSIFIFNFYFNFTKIYECSTL